MLLNYCLKQDKELSLKTKVILKDFYNNFKDSERIVSKINISQNRTVKDIIHKKDIPTPDDFNYIIEPIKKHILDLKISRFAVTYIFDIIKIQFTVSKLDLKKLDKHVYMILCWLNFINKYNTNKAMGQTINLFVYFNKKTKMLPDDENITIQKENVNTGFAVSCVKNSNIIIYRSEEWFKVFIHETIHSLSLDFSCYDTSKATGYILKLFKVKSKVKLYEAYTDTWAKILNVIFSCYFLNTTHSLKQFMEDVNVLMNLEMTFSIFQVVKILKFMKLTYKDLINGDEQKLKLYKENTSILSYYVISSILLNTYEDYFNWCINNNTNILQFDNDNSTYKQIEFCKLIEGKYKSRLFTSRVDEISKIFEKVDNKYLLRNMRKSLCEFEI